MKIELKNTEKLSYALSKIEVLRGDIEMMLITVVNGVNMTISGAYVGDKLTAKQRITLLAIALAYKVDRLLEHAEQVEATGAIMTIEGEIMQMTPHGLMRQLINLYVTNDDEKASLLACVDAVAG